MRGFLLLVASALSLPALANEGMWTFDNFPAAAVKQGFGADISQAWLDHARLSTLRLTNCTASFVSPDGLILTNHHCVESCLAELSSKESSLLQLGFRAATRRDEQRCPAQYADVLVGTEDISNAVLKADAGLNDAVANAARKKLLTTLEQSCEQASVKSKSGKLECQAVRLYQGGQYFLYKYKRYSDLRLVFAPEADIASFGGDPDNFQFPRWSLDFSILRAYENDQPAKTPNNLHIDFAGPAAGQLVFVSGDPGSTARLQTRSQLEFDRDVSLPITLLRASELRGRYIQFSKTNVGDERITLAPLHTLQNGIKVRRLELDALNDDAFMEQKTKAEQALRRLAGFNEMDPWQEIASASQRERALYLPYVFIENAAGFSSALFRNARALVRGTEERLKPNNDRLREFTDAELPRLQRDLYARIPAYPEFEQLTLSFSLERMREWLGPDHPVVRRLMGKESPDALATRLIAETELNDAAFRKRLWEGGKRAVDASRDPMIVLVRSIDGEARAIRKQYEDEVEAPIAAAAERIAAARFRAYGAHTYPDATFTLRLNFGTVQGWTENGAAVEPFTHLDRAFSRATGATPFKIPESWMRVMSRLDMNTPFCFSTSNDIVGGNSGSPLIDVSGRLVGLMFDGNIHSIAGRYWFNPENNRAIALHPAIIREALDKVYGAKELLSELQAN
ncbi:MAG TPA: S46 family peptidase [Steroidobacteraceae bacterium]|nr:S46 family peptidase [Steroidobacteraceae bacterium]